MTAPELKLSHDNIVIRPLTVADHAASVAVENAAFTNPDHRASPDKIAYRLTVCPELTLGLFVRPTAAAAATNTEPDADGNVLVSHIISTRCRDPLASDASMKYPKDWRTAATTSAATATADGSLSAPVGHDSNGTTVALHSLAVVPAAQGKGAGSRLIRAYVEKMATPAGSADGQPPVDRIAIICQDYLVDYYKKLGFTLVGPSAAQFGGGGWFDMIYELPTNAKA